MDELTLIDTRSGVQGYPVSKDGLETFRQAQSHVDQMEVPILLDSKNPHARLFIAGLDGTGNSMVDDKPEEWSAVARIYEQVRDLKYSGQQSIAAGYVEGTFTQTGWSHAIEKAWDGRFGHTFEDRVETAYYQLCVQAKKWKDEDPQAEISVAGVGFSRGSEQLAALQRLIDERGIRDPTNAKVEKNHEGLLTEIVYSDMPVLVAPGKTPQAAVFLDPVSTGVTEHDRRLPPSNIATLTVAAIEERRDLFKESELIAPGFSQGNRDLSVRVSGSHSDIGGTYSEKGLGLLSEHLAIRFINRLSDKDILKGQELPPSLKEYVVHDSSQHMLGLYGTRGYDKDGVRDTVKDLAPDSFCRQDLKACDVREASDPSLVAKYDFFTKEERLHHFGLVEDKSFERGLNALIERAKARDKPKAKVSDDLDALIERAMRAYGGGDAAAQEHFWIDYNASPHGQRWQQEQDSYGREQRALELQDSWQWKQPEHLKVQQPEAMVR